MGRGESVSLAGGRAAAAGMRQPHGHCGRGRPRHPARVTATGKARRESRDERVGRGTPDVRREPASQRPSALTPPGGSPTFTSATLFPLHCRGFKPPLLGPERPLFSQGDGGWEASCPVCCRELLCLFPSPLFTARGSIAPRARQSPAVGPELTGTPAHAPAQGARTRDPYASVLGPRAAGWRRSAQRTSARRAPTLHS